MTIIGEPELAPTSVSGAFGSNPCARENRLQCGASASELELRFGRHDQSGRHPDVFLHELFLRRPCTRDHNAAGLMIMKGQAVFDLMSQSRGAGRCLFSCPR